MILLQKFCEKEKERISLIIVLLCMMYRLLLKNFIEKEVNMIDIELQAPYCAVFTTKIGFFIGILLILSVLLLFFPHLVTWLLFFLSFFPHLVTWLLLFLLFFSPPFGDMKRSQTVFVWFVLLYFVCSQAFSDCLCLYFIELFLIVLGWVGWTLSTLVVERLLRGCWEVAERFAESCWDGFCWEIYQISLSENQKSLRDVLRDICAESPNLGLSGCGLSETALKS